MYKPALVLISGLGGGGSLPRRLFRVDPELRPLTDLPENTSEEEKTSLLENGGIPNVPVNAESVHTSPSSKESE